MTKFSTRETPSVWRSDLFSRCSCRFFNFHHSTASAGEGVTVTFDYCYDTGDNIITFVKYTRTSGGYTVGTVGEELCRIYADGKDAYCLGSGHSLYSGNTLTTDASAAWNALSKAQKRSGLPPSLLYGNSAQAAVTLLRSSSAIPSLLTVLPQATTIRM